MKNRYRRLLVFAMSIALLGCDSGADTKNAAAEKKGYTLTERERQVMYVLLRDEATSALYNGTSMSAGLQKIFGDYVTTTASKLQQSYERNEVAGDQQFRKKTIVTKGIVKSVDRSIGENYFIGLKGGSNPFMEPKASMADGYTDFLAGLEKGDEVSLVCKGNGMLIGSAMLSECVPLNNYVGGKVSEYVATVNVVDMVERKDASASYFVGIVTASSILSDKSSCISGEGLKCHSEIKKVFDSEAYRNAVVPTLTRMKIDVNEFRKLL